MRPSGLAACLFKLALSGFISSTPRSQSPPSWVRFYLHAAGCWRPRGLRQLRELMVYNPAITHPRHTLCLCWSNLSRLKRPAHLFPSELADRSPLYLNFLCCRHRSGCRFVVLGPNQMIYPLDGDPQTFSSHLSRATALQMKVMSLQSCISTFMCTGST
ncbi:hypothetical protein OF83DRAFT_646404 [Amylostereum chailletii]|nr:hypothetical protein OF83DRAFT_646404 [Amylostereum chailletii]